MNTRRVNKLVREVNNLFQDSTRDAARVAANLELIQVLAQYLTDHPTERFGQALRNLGIVSDREVAINAGRGREELELIWDNEFSTEPTATLARVKQTLGTKNV